MKNIKYVYININQYSNMDKSLQYNKCFDIVLNKPNRDCRFDEYVQFLIIILFL